METQILTGGWRKQGFFSRSLSQGLFLDDVFSAAGSFQFEALLLEGLTAAPCYFVTESWTVF